jgi:Fic family protein
MRSLSNILKDARLSSNWKLREASSATSIDSALISKYESGERIPSENHLLAFADGYSLDFNLLRKHWLAEKISSLLRYESNPLEVLEVAESRMEYFLSASTFETADPDAALRSKLAKIDALAAQWKASKPLNATQLRKMREFFDTEYTFESNRIEGNTLSLAETHMVIKEGLTISGKSMAEHLEAINHADAIAFLYELTGKQTQINKRNLLELHTLILKGIDRENAGKYRTVPVRIGGSAHIPPEPYLLDKLMEDYFLHFRQQANHLHPVILAAEVHERLVSIHPFIDGNGRTARLAMNLVLLNSGYTIANLKGDNTSRKAYYHALEQVQVHNAPQVFYHLVADSVEASLEAHLKLV